MAILKQTLIEGALTLQGNTITLDSSSVNPIKLKNLSGELQARNSEDASFVNLRVSNLFVEGTLYEGVDAIVSNNPEIAFVNSVLTLNNDVTGAPSESSGIAIERGASTNAQLLWDEATDSWKLGLVGSLSQISVHGDNLSAFNNDLTTDDLSEGDTNKYYTDERVDDRLSTLMQNGVGLSWSYNDALNTFTPTVSLSSFSTSDLAEGSNLYFTNERVDDRVAALLSQGSNVTLTYDDVNNTLSISSVHPSVSAASSANNSNGTVIQDITLDAYGHITAIGSLDLDARYYTESEVDALLTSKANLSGASFTGNVSSTGTITASSFVGDGSALSGIESVNESSIILSHRVFA